MRTLRLLALGALLLHCTPSESGDAGRATIGPESEPAAVASLQLSSEELAEGRRHACEEQIAGVLAKPGLPGAVGFDARRLEILTRAKAEPVLLTETPQRRDEEPLGDLARGYRQLLETTQHPWGALARMLPAFVNEPKVGRQVLLRDGYLFADNPEMAFALVGLVSAEHLFGHDRIWIARGETVHHAMRKKGRYVFVDGPNEGEPVRLLLLDRIGFGPAPQDSIVRDFRSLQYRLHFDRARVRHLTESQLVVDLQYGEHWIRSLLRSRGAHLELECEAPQAEQLDALAFTRAESQARRRVVQALRYSMQQQIEDQLPFDEPRREWGHQLDGKLRGNWMHAYLTNKSSFAFNGDRYSVFNSRGKPLIPQVCVDFLTDTFEITSGSWWAPKGQPAQRIRGNLDYEPMNILERAKLRRIPGFLAYARNETEKFEVLDLAPSQRIPLGERARLLDFLDRSSDDFQPGDIVVIRGKTPWDPVQMHYHSFFIYESDPLTGIPLALVGNAGRPSVRYWEVEARRTPDREIWHRVRPTTRWLEAILEADRPISLLPPPISPRGNAG